MRKKRSDVLHEELYMTGQAWDRSRQDSQQHDTGCCGTVVCVEAPRFSNIQTCLGTRNKQMAQFLFDRVYQSVQK